MLFFLGLLILQFPRVQTGLAKYASKKLTGVIDGRIEIGSISLHPFNAITLKDVAVIDENPFPDRYGRGSGTLDTLLSVGKLSATISPLSLFRKGGIHIGRVDIEDVLLQLGIEESKEYSVNVTRVLRLGGGEEDFAMPLDTLFSLHKLNVRNGRFRMVNFWPFSYVPPYGIDWGNMDVTFDLKAHDISFHDARVFAVVDRMSAREKCGYEITNLRGSVGVGAGRVNMRNLRYDDALGSRLYMPTANLNYYNNPSAWSNFLRDVELDLHISRSHLVFGSISAYSGNVFHDCPLQADIESARLKGPVSNFKVSDMVFSGSECDVQGSVSCAITGIPKTSQMYLDATVDYVRFTTEGLKKVLSDLGSGADLSRFAPGTVFTATGTGSGLLSDLSAKMRLTSSIGSVRIDGGARNISVSGKPIEFRANLSGESLDLGKLLGSPAMGPGTFTAVAEGRLGSPMQVNLRNLSVSSLNLLGYEYSDLSASALMQGSSVLMRFASDDPNALANIRASLDWKNQTGHIEAEISELDLAKLNLDTRGGKSSVSCMLVAEQGLDKEEPAQIRLSDLTLTNDSGTYFIGDIEALARLNGDRVTLTLNSDAIDAKYNGTSNFGALVNDIRSVTVDRHLPSYFAPDANPAAEETGTRDCELSAVFHDTKDLLAFIFPNAAINSGTAVNIEMDNTGRLMGYISSPGLSFNNIKAEGFDLSMDNLDGTLDCTVSADMLSIGGLPFSKAAFLAQADADLLSTSLTYDNAGLLEGGSELFVDAAFSRDASDSLRIDVFTHPSQISIKGDVWELDEATVNMSSTRIDASGLQLSCGEQSIRLEGGVSNRNADTLSVRFQELDLDIINDFLGGKIPKLQGLLNGDATLLSPLPSKFGLFAGLDLHGLTLDGIPAGDFRLDSDFDDKNRLITLSLDNTVDDRKALSVNGTYGTRDNSINARASLDSLDARIATPFIKSILSGFGGYLHGDIDVSGTTKNIKLSSEGLRLDGVRGKVYHTKVTYILDGTVGVEDNTLMFRNIGVKDEYGGMGVLKGSLALGQFKAPRIDAELDMNRLKAIDIHGTSSPILIYGDLAVSGNTRIRGPFTALGIDADVTSAGTGTVNVPIPSSSAASGGNLLTFTAPASTEAETEEAPVEETPPPASRGVVIHAKAKVTPDVLANVEIDKESGHVLTAAGLADVTLDLNTAKSKLQLKGDYLIDKGKYLFNIPGIVSKEFDIREGSTIKFNGDVMESTLDIHAVHNVKTSLATLVADSTAVNSRRNVECGLNIGGKLRGPEVSFAIDVPDLDPTTKVAVDAALGTPDKIQKQFVALLLLGTFIPEENSGVVNGNNMIYSNVGEIVAGQLNNILQKLEIPLDFGFGYQQDYSGTDLFDVAVSTQLFNNRLVVGGSLGNRKYSTSKSYNGELVGDLDIELKLDNSGELRFKLFSHSADEYTSSLDYSQRNGIGFSFQKEYNRWVDFFRDLFKSRKRKQQEALDALGKKKEMKIIEIE